ncbi:MAG: DUF805 domain-containing protein [Planctomycetaceae bacterium]|jgi:uncharacterized membrane protein YhaH (DUF805 family)|nr:DUF805 domain-containing protein [Planctomycetaceae bacterium]
MNYYIAVLQKYAVFSGRARRAEYWMFTLVNVLIAFALGFIAGLIDPVIGVPAFSLIYMVYILATIVPGLAALWRRLHDTGRSGLWWFIAFVPLVGGIILLVYLVQDSEQGSNQYGPYPK